MLLCLVFFPIKLNFSVEKHLLSSAIGKMNFYVIFHVIIGASIVIARPVDVNNDDRPLINYISPHQIEDLVKLHAVFFLV